MPTSELPDAEQLDEDISGEQPVARAKSLPLAPPRPDTVPELVPARMLNELIYCERLMYLEWVQSEWADNRFTIDGKAVHRRVDKKSQVLKPRKQSGAASNVKPMVESNPDETTVDEKPYTARSVWLSSEKLGLTAKIDVVDVDGSTVVPIEYKRGREPEHGPYLPERAQVAVQVLLLREHGYECPSGEIYFAEDKRRVPVDVTPQLEQLIEHSVSRAKELLRDAHCPPPLEDNPKCNGCSLSGICLPDEVNALNSDDFDWRDNGLDPLEVGDDPWGLAGPQPELPPEKVPRRLFPARDDKIPLYVQGQGAALRLSGQRLVVSRPGESAVEARLTNTSSVTLYGNVQITAQAQRRLMEEGIPLIFASSGGWIVGRAVGAESKNVELRAAQYARASDSTFCLALAKRFVKAKIANSRTLLRRNDKNVSAVTLGELKQLGRKVDEVDSIASLLGIEGSAARVYFQAFEGMLKSDVDGAFHFDTRNRRPPKDPVNALLSFCYSLLTRETTVAAQCAGLDPLLGFYHQPRFGRASLALDLMEEFRPVLADSTVISVINNGVVSPTDFVRGRGAVALKPAARKKVIQAMERRLDQLVTHPVFDYRLSYRRVLEVQARLLSRVLLGEVPHYPAFVVR